MTKYFSFGWIRNTTTTIAAVTLLSGCLSDEEAKAPTDVDTTAIELSGSVGDGPVVGSNMSVRANSGALLAEFQSDTNAGYNVTIEALDEYYPISIDATGGTDLVTNSAPDFDMSSAVFESGTNQIANVNPFSTLAVELARQRSDGLTLKNLEDAQRIISGPLNSGLIDLALTGPISTQIDETNVAEVVKASETLSELLRRTRDLLQAAGITTDGNQLVRVLSSDLMDGIVDGVGGSSADGRTSAVATIANAQVLLESMANELRVNGSDASAAMNTAIDRVSPAPVTITTDQLGVTSQMISKVRIGLAAAYEIDADPAILQLHTAVSDIQSGQNATLVRVMLPPGYRTVLQSALSLIGNADSATIDIVNAIARGNGDIDAPNLAPSIQGTPDTSVTVASNYSFTPVALDVDGDVLTFAIVNQPSWANFDTATGQLAGTPAASDVGSFAGIAISVTDGEFTSSLLAFTIEVTAANGAPQITGNALPDIGAGSNYSFIPTASDPDGDTLTFSISGMPSWASFDTATGELSGTPAASDVGSHPSIVIAVTDGEFTASLAAFTITVNAVGNSAPQISGNAPADVSVGGNYSFVPTASDADGDTLTFSISGMPAWASFNTSTGELSGTPVASDVGSYPGNVIAVTDGALTASLPAFTITVNAGNSAPQISGSAPADVNVGDAYSFTPTASDADGDTLTFSVSGLPSWASFSTSTGQISGTPAAGDVGTYSNISITVSDGQASATLASFTITVQAISLGSVTLNWTAPTENEDGTPLTDLVGYKIYWGTTPGTYPNSTTINNGSVTTFTVDNLTAGTYEFVATAVNSAGVESSFSNNATATVP